jgi:hypothetical protein
MHFLHIAFFRKFSLLEDVADMAGNDRELNVSFRFAEGKTGIL